MSRRPSIELAQFQCLTPLLSQQSPEITAPPDLASVLRRQNKKVTMPVSQQVSKMKKERTMKMSTEEEDSHHPGSLLRVQHIKMTSNEAGIAQQDKRSKSLPDEHQKTEAQAFRIHNKSKTKYLQPISKTLNTEPEPLKITKSQCQEHKLLSIEGKHLSGMSQSEER